MYTFCVFCFCVLFFGQYFLCEIRGFHIGGAENSALQRCDTMSLEVVVDIFKEHCTFILKVKHSSLTEGSVI